MNILFLKGFNNYFNRTVKKYSTLADYRTNSSSYVEFSNINFNPNDGVVTELIIGSPTQLESNAALAWEDIGTPDYCICYETENNVDTIKFRWFVLESERTRNGQYRLALKRDVIAEHFTEIMTAPCFVEKGIITDWNDPLLVNNEGGNYNQIKQSEILLKDETKVAWLVGYMKKDAISAAGGQDFSATLSTDTVQYYNYNDIPFKTFINMGTAPANKMYKDVQTSLEFSLGIAAGDTAEWCRGSTNLSYNGSTYSKLSTTGSSLEWGYSFQIITFKANSASAVTPSAIENIINSGVYHNTTTPDNNSINFLNYAKTQTISSADYILTQAEYNTYNNALMLKDGQYYRLNISIGNWATKTSSFNRNDSTAVSYAQSVASAATATYWAFPSAATPLIKYYFAGYEVTISATPVATAATLTTHIGNVAAGGRYQCEETTYDYFAIPFIPAHYRTGTAPKFYDANGTLREINSDASMAIASKIITDLGGSGTNTTLALDLQILPYCPISFMTGNYMDLRNLNSKSYSVIYMGTNATPCGFILFPQQANFTKDISQGMFFPVFQGESQALAKKLRSNTEFYRLTSPNFASSFEFNLWKFAQYVSYFNIDCSYKPFSPYIKINPNYSGLYGQDFNDATGLILSGDFSLPTISEPWIQYQLANKNYEAMFNRQIQSLDVSNKIAQEQLQFSNQMGMFTGVGGGAAAGLALGLKTGNPYVAAAGAVVGGVAGGAMASYGAELNQDWLNRQQAESKSYAIDMYTYNLGNIQALPNSVSKTSPLTYNNKIWPIIEKYSCTSQELANFKEKIKYNSMTIMNIKTLADYATSTDFDKVYVKGQLIRVDTINDDFHIIDAIYQEVNKGFYIPQ